MEDTQRGLEEYILQVCPVFCEGSGRQELARSYPEGKVVLRTKLSMSMALRTGPVGSVILRPSPWYCQW